MGLYYVMGVYYAFYGTCIAVREHLGDYQLMCHAPVALHVTVAVFVPDNQRIQLIRSHTTSSVGVVVGVVWAPEVRERVHLRLA